MSTFLPSTSNRKKFSCLPGLPSASSNRSVFLSVNRRERFEFLRSFSSGSSTSSPTMSVRLESRAINLHAGRGVGRPAWMVSGAGCPRQLMRAGYRQCPDPGVHPHMVGTLDSWTHSPSAPNILRQAVHDLKDTALADVARALWMSFTVRDTSTLVVLVVEPIIVERVDFTTTRADLVP